MLRIMSAETIRVKQDVGSDHQINASFRGCSKDIQMILGFNNAPEVA